MIEQLKHIRAIVTDVDGVLTDGSITLDANGQETKTFSVADGQLMSFAREQGVFFGVISGRTSHALNHRLDELRVDFRSTASKDKRHDINQFISETGVPAEHILYIGDDLPDLQVLGHVGLFACPADASSHVQAVADLIAESNGGKGVLRDILELWVRAKGLEVEMLNYYSKHV